MSGPSPGDGNGRAEVSENGAGVLANLPRTRPQRATARRAAARRSDGPGASANGDSTLATKRPAKAKARTARASKPALSTAGQRAKPASSGQAKRAPAAARPRRATPIVDPAPRQGYECLEERATGAVAPPGGADLVNTAIEAFGELAKAGLSSGERLLRDVLSRLPG